MKDENDRMFRRGIAKFVPGYSQCPSCYSRNTQKMREYRRPANQYFPAADMVIFKCHECECMFSHKARKQS